MPKVSIIVPIYNVEKYLDRCMQTLINQTLKDIEIIMVDDGSPDNCPQMCDNYAKRDNRIKVIHKKNGGLSDARNAGLNIATGEYVAFIDSDDFTSLNAYENLYNVAQNGDYDIVYAGFVRHNEKGNIIKCFTFNKEYIGTNIINFLSEMLYHGRPKNDEEEICMSVWNAIYRKRIIDDNNIKFMSERVFLSEDILFHSDILPCCKRIRCIPNHFYNYCYNGTSLTHSFNPKKIDAAINLYEAISTNLNKYNLGNLQHQVMLFFITYIRGIIMKNIFFSDLPYLQKKEMCNKIYEYKGWDNIFKEVPIKSRPFLEQMILYTIKNHAFFINYSLFKIYYSIKKSRYQ